MRKSKKKFALLLVPFMLASCKYEVTEITGGKDINPFSFVGNSEISELNIDGKNDEEQWSEGEYTSPEYKFSYKNHLNEEIYEYSIQVYRGIKELFIFFKVHDCNIVTLGNDNGSNVSASDSCEIYLDTQFDKNVKPQSDDYQINLGVHEKTRMLIGNGVGWTSWNGIVQYETYIDGTLNDQTDVDNYYSIEASIPYKQIGITRDQTIGMTFGLVDRYSMSGGTTSKMWYRTVINNHYGNPQDPSTYFEFKKNELVTPSIREYIPSEDTTVYSSDFELTIPEAVVDTDEFAEIDYKIALHNNTLTVLASTSDNWPSYEGICFAFDFGNKRRNEGRNQNTILLRAFPATRTYLDFFRYPNIGLDKTSVDIRMSDKCVYASFDIAKYKTEEFDGVNFCACSITVVNNVVTKSLVAGKTAMKWDDISSYLTINTENVVEMFSNKNTYNFEDDDTEYMGASLSLQDTVDSDSEETFAEKSIELSRTRDIVTLLVHNNGPWSPNEELVFNYDFGNPSRTVRDGNVLILRIFPRRESIKDFFYFDETKTQADRSLLTISFYKQEVKVEFVITDIVSGIDDYFDDGVGVATALANNKDLILRYCTYNGTVLGVNPSKWPRLGWNNTIVGA